MTNDRALKRFWGFAFKAAWGTGLVVLLAGAGPGCKKGGEEPAAEAGVTLMGNAVKGGLNTQVAEWYEEVLPPLQQELGFPVRYISAGIPDQDFKARAALDIKSGKGPDIMDLDQFWIPEFAEAGFLLPLDPYFADWPDRTQSYEGVQRMGQYRGHTYMVVWNADLRLLFYHRPILEQAGIKLPWQPQSWEDLIAAARKIQAKVPGVTPLQIDAGVEMGEAATMQGFYMVLLGAGGNLYDYEDHQWIGESPALRKAVGFYHRIYQMDKLADAQLQVSAKARDKSFERFQKGRIAIYLEGTWFYTSVLDPKGPWGIPDRDQRIGWAYMPKEKPGAPGAPNWVTISGGDGLVINPNCRRPERAWKVVAALNALSRQTRLFQRKPFTPTRRDLAALPEVKKNRFIAETAEALMPITTSRPGLAEYQEISFQVQLLTERVATGQMTVEQGLGEYEKALQAVARDKMIKNPDHP
jgi:multiple sugar transport system substrate-binding protein